MHRRTFLATSLGIATAPPLYAALRRGRWDDAAEVLERAAAARQVDAAVLHVVHKDESFTRHFGKATSGDAMFLLGSISKLISVTALMSLFDQGKFQLHDRVKKFLPAFTGDSREDVTIRHLLTHVSGLPDQLANNNELRKRQASLTEFVDHTLRTPLQFAPGARYQYSSMGILLAARAAELISGSDILTLVDRTVFQALGMKTQLRDLGVSSWKRWSHARWRALLPNREAGIRRPRSGTGIVPTGGSWALLGVERTLPRRTWANFYPSSSEPAARCSSRKRHG